MARRKNSGEGAGPLIAAAQRGDTDAVKEALANGANVDGRDENRMTALHWAAWGGHTETVKELINAGADIITPSGKGRTVFDLAARHPETLAVLEAKRDVRDPLIDAADRGDTKAVRAMLVCGANVKTRDSDGMTALHWAAMGGHTETVMELINAGANVKAKSKRHHSALILAAWGNHVGTVSELIKAGAELDYADANGRTALDHAEASGYLNTVKVLLAAGAKRNEGKGWAR